MNINWTVVCTLLCIGGALCDKVLYAPIVQTNEGKVRGIVQQSEDGRSVHQYQGIRYGRADRFRKPRPVEPWTGVYNATHWRDACSQTDFDKPPFGPGAQTPTMSEDCLFVNVWRPAEEKTNRSVMFYIHGGSFEHGTIFSVLYDGRYLASHGDVIVVTVNYRLGILGFLYGGTEDAPGNQAVHDQILALRWVRANIHHFGGDPNQITIFGESAGAFSITAMILSPLTKGMFRRAILQSGAPTSLTTNAVNKPLDRARAIGSYMKCTGNTMNETLTCLRGKSVGELLELQKMLKLFGQVPGPIFEDDILPINAVPALKAGKYNKDIDLMYGVTRDEGSIFIAGLFKDLDSNQTVLTVESTHARIVQMLTLVYGNSSQVKEIADFYTKDLNNPSQTELRLVIAHVYGDPGLMCSTILFGEHVAKLAPNNRYYSYRVTRHSTVPFPILGGCDGWRGVCHGEDIVYLFAPQMTKTKTAYEYELSKDMITAWTSFAKTGDPGKMGSVQWTEAFDKDNQYTRHMTLDSADYRMVSDYYKQTCNVFWQPKIFS